jgi:endogenous inhibitor of DNA gyrase (YacG/DUF329 family)
MAEKRSQVELARMREEFRARADQAFDQMFGSDGQNGLVTFTEREDRACEATDALARWLMEEHLALDAAADPGVQVDCPLCGGPVRYDSPEQAQLEIREFQTRRGKVEYERAARRCPRCRKFFFPVGRASEAGNGRLQSAAAGQD